MEKIKIRKGKRSLEIIDKRVDNGKAFDWGRTSENYAKYRDIYPEVFYEKIAERGLCVNGQKILDLGTGTGVLPRNMYKYGAKWTGADISDNQIEKAREMSKGTDIEYFVSPAEKLCFDDGAFDVITACQCFWYFDHEKIADKFYSWLRPGGRLLLLYMAWLPYEDNIAGESEKLVLRYNPGWTGAGETRHPIDIPECYNKYFELKYHEEYETKVYFTRESWNGRMKACRGVEASLTAEETAQWEKEHIALLKRIAPEEFDILHYAAMAELVRKA